MNIKIPNLSLVLMVGASGSGKSSFAKKHFLSTEVLSSDACRGLVSDDPNNQAATNDAFDVLDYIARKRLAAGRLTVIDATNVQPESRKNFVNLAREFHVLPVAIVLDLPEKICTARNKERPDRNFGARVIRQQRSQLRRSIRRLKREGFRHVYVMDSEEQVDAAAIERVPLWNDRRVETGPFDFIGDVHGCCDELETLLGKLGYERTDAQPESGWSRLCFKHPANRKAVFVGDLVDRGPRSVDVLSLVKNMIDQGSAICVPGNHDIKLLRKLRGKDVKVRHGLAETLADIERVTEEHREDFKKSLAEFLDGLVSHYVLDGGRLVVAHAGLREEMQGRGSGKVRSFALYGETTGETDEFGLPVRHNWAAEYRGEAMVVYGHTPIPEPQWLNKTINIDTGCVFGGKLTGMRYPEQELVSVDAIKVYCEPVKPLYPTASQLTDQQLEDDLLDADDVLGKRIVSTRLRNNITIREENSTAALEVISRFAVNPKWLIYLPPTMSPAETSSLDGFLEHPQQAFDYFRSAGVSTVVCEEKHMGSRAVAVVCKDEQAARKRFGIEADELGVVYTRTGRRFFHDQKLEREFLKRIAASMTAANFWERFESDWVCLDCELMPWSAKAQELLQSQYAAVGAAGRSAIPNSISALQTTSARLEEAPGELSRLIERLQTTEQNVDRFVNAYRQYCWTVESINDLKLAPFHVLATENGVHIDKNHDWHMSEISTICEQDSEILLTTRYQQIDLNDDASIRLGIQWWTEMTDAGGEGMVVKPLDFITKGSKGLNQPAIKCRGKEYLRIIYGPDYDTEKNLSRLRIRHLGRKPLTRYPRICIRRRIARTIRKRRTFTQGARMRVWRFGIGKRTGRSSIVATTEKQLERNWLRSSSKNFQFRYFIPI